VVANWTVDSANPIRIYVTARARRALLSGQVTFAGWAIGDADAVSGVAIAIDGTPSGGGMPFYGGARPDVCAVFPTGRAARGWLDVRLQTALLPTERTRWPSRHSRQRAALRRDIDIFGSRQYREQSYKNHIDSPGSKWAVERYGFYLGGHTKRKSRSGKWRFR